jgi:hypothetical protein
MTKKDFFRLILKIFGLYTLVLFLFTIVPGNLVFVLRDFNLFSAIWLLLTISIISLLFVFLIYKPDYAIRLLKLEKGFDEDRIEFQNFSNSNILKLAVIVIGGILLIRNIPAFLSHVLFAFKSSAGNNFNNNSILYGQNDYFNWAVSFINIILGYLLLAYYKPISRILNEKGNEEKKSLE